MMRLLFLATLWAALSAWPAHAQSASTVRVDLSAYQDQQGAITVRIGGDFADPYFAIRALLSAHQAGAGVNRPASALIAWLLPRQQADGSFPRFCRQPGAQWLACASADADDALVAMWAQLLYTMAPCSGMPDGWQRSAAHALRHLSSLRDPQRGTYRISLQHETSLFMDNTEIYAALNAIAARQSCMGQSAAARANRHRAQQLQVAMEQVFRPQGQKTYLVSTQVLPQTAFYPHQAAQVYPVLFGMQQGAAAQASMQSWLAGYEEIWLARSGDDSPWGLVALAAQMAGAQPSALRWLEHAAPMRHGQHWTVLEEAAFQSLCGLHRTRALACRAVLPEQASR